MNTGEGKAHHPDMLTVIPQKVVPGSMTAWVGLLDMEEVHPLQAMEDDLHQDHHLHLEDMEDNLQGLHRHLEDMEDNLLGLHRRLEATEEDLQMEDTGESHHHPDRRFLEAMGEALCQVESMHMQDKRLR